MDFSEWFSRERQPGERTSYEVDAITGGLDNFENNIKDELRKRGYEFDIKKGALYFRNEKNGISVDICTYWQLNQRKAIVYLEALAHEPSVEA